MKPSRCASLTLTIAVLGMAGCVSLDEAPIPSGAVRPDQRTAVVVYIAPGPWVTQEQDTKAESAAKILPGVGQFMQSVQDDGDLKASNELRQYYTVWPGAAVFRETLAAELRKAEYPGIPVSWESAGAPAHVFERFNRAENVLDWRKRYFLASQLDLRNLRDYSQVLEFDGHLILEVNVQYGLMNNAEGNSYPSLQAFSRLYRANTMKLLWSRSDLVDDKTEPRNIYEFKASPALLSEKLDKLSLPLAASIAAALRAALPAAPLPDSPPAPGEHAPATPAEPSPTAPAVPVAPAPDGADSVPTFTREGRPFVPVFPQPTTSQIETPLSQPATRQTDVPAPAPAPSPAAP
ncbi:MAG: hypothetical protein HZB91_08925 [Elusimicrobia bacterium]|nr:hypothetical protein [Elusimicrobiota bacterium]